MWKTVTAESPLCTLTVVTIAAQRTSEQRVQKVTLQITGSLMEEVGRKDRDWGCHSEAVEQGLEE